MLKTAVILAMLLTLPALCSEAWARPARPLTARQAFALIPTEIFDNTREPLSEADRAQLADQGVTEHWSIAEDSCDTLRLASAEGLPDVSLQMFRSKKGAVAAFRTEDDNGECISELWYISAGGHAAPLPLPPEPPVEDFFHPDRDLPGRLSASCTYCVFDNGLEVLPSFASDGFPCELEPDNAVYYLWSGCTFMKKIKKLR